VKIHKVGCAVCNGSAAIVGFWCLCAAPTIPETQPFEPEETAIVRKAPEPQHGVESEIEHGLVTRPVAAIPTLKEGRASIIEGNDIALGLGEHTA
jgi:hypothetical protein